MIARSGEDKPKRFVDAQNTVFKRAQGGRSVACSGPSAGEKKSPPASQGRLQINLAHERSGRGAASPTTCRRQREMVGDLQVHQINPDASRSTSAQRATGIARGKIKMTDQTSLPAHVIERHRGA